MKLPQMYIVFKGGVICWMPILTEAEHVKWYGVQQLVDGFYDLQWNVLLWYSLVLHAHIFSMMTSSAAAYWQAS